jgi:hypothetical protein
MSTDAEFFITNGVPSTATQQAFDFNYTIFGQLVSGQQTVNDLARVAVQANSTGEASQPITPVNINAVALSPDNPNGVLHINSNSAKPGETATITVTATDPSDNTMVSRTFKVTVSAYNGPTTPVINFVPFANTVTTSTKFNSPVNVQLNGQSGYPGAHPTGAATLSYQLVSQPAHGTISQFNAATGSFMYTPESGYSGPDSFQYLVLATGSNSAPAVTTSQPATVSITVAKVPLVTLTRISDVLNKRHQVTQIFVYFSGPVNDAQARISAIYRLALPGRKGSYTAKNARIIRLKKAVYDALGDKVTLQLGTPYGLTKTKVHLRINGLAPAGLTDGMGRLIDGDHNGTSGGNALAYISRFGVNVSSFKSK